MLIASCLLARALENCAWARYDALYSRTVCRNLNNYNSFSLSYFPYPLKIDCFIHPIILELKIGEILRILRWLPSDKDLKRLRLNRKIFDRRMQGAALWQHWWRCFDFELGTVHPRKRSIKKRITATDTSMRGWVTTKPVHLSESLVGNRRADIFHEWRTTVNAHPSVSAYFHEWNVYEKIYPRIMRKWTKEAPVSAVSIALFRCETARLIQNGRQLNAMIKSLTVSKSSRV